MANISFQPTFHHLDWVDDQDRVRADAPNGFNERFNAIEADLQQLSTVVGAIDTAIDALGTQSSQLRITLPPAFGLTVRSPWVINATGAAVVRAGSAAAGIVPLTIAPNLRFVSFRAIGQTTSVPVTISLFRFPIHGGSPQEMARLTGDANPFDKTANVDPALGPTGAAFRYAISANAAITPSGAVTVQLAAFQIVLNPA